MEMYATFKRENAPMLSTYISGTPDEIDEKAWDIACRDHATEYKLYAHCMDKEPSKHYVRTNTPESPIGDFESAADLKGKLVTVETDNMFYAKNFEKACEELEKGNSVHLYCWCTGHTRCAMVEEEYERKLREKYGDKLVVVHPGESWREFFKLV